MTLAPPTFDDVLAARERISPYLRETALNNYPALDEEERQTLRYLLQRLACHNDPRCASAVEPPPAA